jgi:hypothetical protein
MRRVTILSLFLGSVIFGGCGQTDNRSTPLCVPGQTEPCTCTTGAAGAQTCREDGSGFDSCVCDGTPPGDTSPPPDTTGYDIEDGATDTNDPKPDVDVPTPDTDEPDVETTEPPDDTDVADVPPPPEDTAPADTGTPVDVSDVAETSEPDCQGLSVCEGFEESTPGGPPNPATWQVGSPNCSGDGTIVVDDTWAHSGKHSIRVDSSGGYCNHIFANPIVTVTSKGTPLYGRFYVRFETALGPEHITFVALKDETQNKDLRMGGQNKILMWNRELDDATLPVLSPKGVEKSIQPPAKEWICIEFMVDGDAGALSTWVNGALIEGLIVDSESTPDVDQQWHNMAWYPSLVDARFGWESYGNVPMTLWYDDIALSEAPIGCLD